MTKQFTETVFSNTYRDDFADSAGYHRILYNSGRAVQARELTQMQTIIQREVERFGRNIFKEGASVNPGGPTINAYEFIKLDTTINALPADPDVMVGTVMTGQTSGIKARVLQVVPAEGSDPATIYVRYLDTITATSGDEAIRMYAGEIISNGTNNLTVQTTNTSSNPATGAGTRFSNAAGDFFVQGHFVYAPPQSIILSKYARGVTAVVGFKVLQDIVTAEDNVALYDNQGANPNLTSPGADRYRIRLELVNRDDVDSDENFVFFANVVDGKVVQQAKGTDEYNKINDLMATRTFEESGNYIVRNFRAKFEEHPTDDTKLILDVSPGTAYINGYRGHRATNTRLEVNKPTSTTLVNNEVAAADFGNYVIFNVANGLPNINEFESRNLYNAVAGGGSVIGTCRIRAVEEDGATWKAYLFDIQMGAGQSFRNVKSIGAGSGDYIDLVLGNSYAELKETSNSSLLFSLPAVRPQTISDISLTVQRRFTAITDGSGNTNISLSTVGETFANTNDWVMADSDIFVGGVSGAGTQSASITGAPPSTTIEVLAYVNKANATPRAKTLQETTVTVGIDSDGSGLQYLDLGRADVFAIDRVTVGDSDGASLENSFTFDNGQRDNFYALSRLILKNGISAPNGNVFVRYRYFQHGATGDFFCVNSYSGQVDYADIPNIRLNTGEVVALRNVLDFRPVQNASGNFSGGNARIHEIPQNTDLITMDVTYYNRRSDKLGIDELGDLVYIEGQPGLVSEFPATPTNVLELYKIAMNPNTISPTDLTNAPIEAKRYTMADIARLEAKLDKLKEATALSLLEANTESLLVFDSAGLPRTKSGFFVDNFFNQAFSATYSPDYAASIDPQDGALRPSFFEDNIRLVYDSAASTGVVLRGDNLYLDYTEVNEITQNQVSGTENINPFAVITNRGHVKLSPSSDEWKESRRVADKVIDGGVQIDTSQALLWNNWEWNWGGIADGNLPVGTVLAEEQTGPTTRNNRARWQGWRWHGGWQAGWETPTTVDRVVRDETIRETIDDRIVDVALIPFMRSRFVSFRAQGLRPNTKHFPFFDGKDVSDWCLQEPFFNYGSYGTDWGNLGISVTEHPYGPSDLVSDANGTLEGSFWIPNTDTLRFASGTREFRLLDISRNVPADSLSWARSHYYAQGTIETWQRTVRATRYVEVVGEEFISVEYFDPLAQSFLVEQPNGMYVTSVQVYFASKDSVVPVQLQIRPMVNGHPSSTEVVPGSVKYLNPSEVNVVSTQTQAGVIGTPTTFTFEEPIFLSPGTEYAIVLLAESTDYNVYIAQTKEFLLGSTEQRVTKQPTLGSLFKSQNGSTWEPVQTQDLAFNLRRADFTQSTGEIILNNAEVPRYNLGIDPLLLDSGSSTVYVSHPSSGMDVGDVFELTGLDSSSTYGGILGSSLAGQRVVLEADGQGYTFAADSAATANIQVGGLGVRTDQNILFDVANPYVEFMLPKGTNISASARYTSAKSYAGVETRFVKDPSYNVVGIRANQNMTNPRMVANADNELVNMSGEKSATIKLSISSNSNVVSPLIDLQRCSLTTVANMIDNQDSDATSGFNVPINWVSEEQPTGGTALAKHITTPVTLAQDAVGINLLFAANRPPAATIDVYYRTADDGVLDDQPWVKVTNLSNTPADKNPNVYREYTALIGGEGGTMSPFTQFQIKLVFNSTNSSQVPIIRDLRAIAMAV